MNKKTLIWTGVFAIALFAALHAMAQNNSISGTQSSGTGALPGWFPSIHITGQAPAVGHDCLQIDSTGNVLDSGSACGGGSSLTLSTTGNTGASVLSGCNLNIPVYQGAITLTTSGSGGASTFSGNVLNIPQYSGGASPGGSSGQIQ